MSIEAVIAGTRTWHVEATDVLAGLRAMPDRCVHCAVTSPPYFGLRDYGVDGQIGLEKSLDEFLAKMVAVCEEVRRVLRDDGTFWVNMGDSYACGETGRKDGGKREADKSPRQIGEHQAPRAERRLSLVKTWKPKDKLLVPWRLALALQATGWYVRDVIVWHKPAPMPESVTDRCTQAWEPIFLLAKAARYFYDAEAVKEESEYGGEQLGICRGTKRRAEAMGLVPSGNEKPGSDVPIASLRNLRNVWTLPPEPFPGAHFATFPTELPRRCIRAGTSEWGVCPECGGPWKRIVERTGEVDATAKGSRFDAGKTGGRSGGDRTQPGERFTKRATGWQPTCKCDRPDVVPAIVLEPVAGSGTRLMVARRLGRRAIGFELNPDYADMARKRVTSDAPLLNAQ